VAAAAEAPPQPDVADDADADAVASETVKTGQAVMTIMHNMANTFFILMTPSSIPILFVWAITASVMYIREVILNLTKYSLKLTGKLR
jgi:hypothetical protein